VMALNLRTIPARLGSSGVAIVGIAGVVVVFVSVLSIAAGFSAAMRGSGSPDRALVLRSGADSELTSGIDSIGVDTVKLAPGIRYVDGFPLASAELYVIIDVPKKSAPTTSANVPMRGIEPAGMTVRDEVRIVDGRMFTFGTNEVIVGRGAALQFAGLTVGSELRQGTNVWNVVGVFADNGSVSESEIWSDAIVLQGAYNRGASYQSTRVRLESAAALQTFKDALTSDPRVNVRVFTEREYYAQQARSLVALVTILGRAIAILMGIAAIFGALNTMYSAVSERSREIAVLRALGFGGGAIVLSFFVESLLIALVGGLVGCIAVLPVNGLTTGTINWQTFSHLAFAFRITPDLLALGMLFALVMGAVGGLPPAIRAARANVAHTLRAL